MTLQDSIRLSVIMPVYNEEATIRDIVSRVLAISFVSQLIIVDDGSTDRTVAHISRAAIRNPDRIVALLHARNRGKGSAIHTATPHATGDIIIIQDADVEYNPADYARLIAPFAHCDVGAVYGSRNMSGNPRGARVHVLGVWCVTMLANMLYGARLTDLATGYKVFRRTVFTDLCLRSERFGFDAEATAQLLKRGRKIVEVPISYTPRLRQQGKKIHIWDGLLWIWITIRERFSK